jgi:zinc protease
MKKEIFAYLLALMPLNVFDNVKQIDLNNGMRVLLKEEHSLPIVSVQCWVKAGTMDEKIEDNGVAHFLEHMLFKGTGRYYVGEISKIVESCGGSMNAATSHDFTCLYIDIPSEHLKVALEVMREVLIDSQFPSDEIERERKVILEEIKRREDDVDSYLWDLFNENIYHDTMYKYRVIGSTATVSRISRNTLINFYKKHYIPEKFILVIVGDYRIDDWSGQIISMFNEIAPTTLVKGDDTSVLAIEKDRRIFQIKKLHKVEHAHLICGFLGPTCKEYEQYVADVISVILGNGRTSRLYKTLYQKKRLVYSISSNYFTRCGSGLFTISAQFKEDNFGSVYKEILKELNSIKLHGVSKKELEMAKIKIVNDWLFSNETYHDQASTIGYGLVLNNLDYVKNYVRNVSKVSVEDIKKFMNLYLPQELSYIVLLPEKNR